MLLASITLALAIAGAIHTQSGSATTTPTPRLQEPAWVTLHERFIERAKSGGIDLLFLGDSITQGWGESDTWKRHYAPRNAANFAIGGDRTQHLLWRLDHGELEGLAPKIAVVLIGTNNIGNATVDEIADGVKAVVERLRSKLPKTRILLLGIFPRGLRIGGEVAAMPDPRVGEVNRRIQKLAADKTIRFLDLEPVFLDGEGNIRKELMPDYLHLSDEGYRAWANGMEPALWSLSEMK
jgi:beta-glucosidase